ncbi:hypothetical protein BB559_004999 [Furculomyces boomerangus]|uniref:Palmitoyltransferase n=2 Tax=Harpellales TaxID=61421 RepID=A0A2T9YBF0_9FUNG|nr:hypothetical protein BB559_004999 [Furculomyces boomerangus]PVZ99742.1 hypothetical protein BB558_004227 [Smittium angustum]
MEISKFLDLEYTAFFAVLFFVMFCSIVIGSTPRMKDSKLRSFSRFFLKRAPAYIKKNYLKSSTSKEGETDLSVDLNETAYTLYKFLFILGYSSFMLIFWVMIFPRYSQGYFGTFGSTIPKILTIVFVPLNAFLYFLVHNTNPGYITKENNEKALKMYEFDYVLYTPKYCEICKIKCPARSHHCNVCNACVAAFDHHCVLTNRCVVMLGIAGKNGYPLSFYYDAENNEFKARKFFYVFMGLYNTNMLEWVLGMVLILTMPVCGIYLLFQLYIHLVGLTSYEIYTRMSYTSAIKEKSLYFVIPPKDSGKKMFVKIIKPEDEKKDDDIIAGSQKRLITSMDQIPHLYDKGFFQNLKNILFPETL